jgi:hypothetical protein
MPKLNFTHNKIQDKKFPQRIETTQLIKNFWFIFISVGLFLLGNLFIGFTIPISASAPIPAIAE